MNPFAIEVVEEPSGFLMAAEAIPNDQQGSLEMAPELLDKGKNILASDVSGKHREIEA
jgi:hypothetical protein